MRQAAMSFPGTAVCTAVLLLMVTGTSGQMVRFVEKQKNVEEGEQFTVMVELLGTITQDVRVIVEIDKDIADDFIGDTQVATFTPSSSIAYTTFTVRDDEEPENKELFYLRLIRLSDDVYVGSPSTVAVTIDASDDAYGVFSFLDVSPVVVREETFTTAANLRVGRAVSFFSTVQLTFEVNSTSDGAQVGLDVSPATGSVTFTPNQREAVLQLRILADGVPEDNETFSVRLTYATGNARINVSEVTLVIAANDAPIRFSQETYVYDEGPDTNTYTVDVLRGVDASGNTVGPINTSVGAVYRFEAGTAVQGDDYSSTDGLLKFEPGETRKTIAFVIEDDEAPEQLETFRIRLASTRNDSVFVSPNVAEVGINANDHYRGVITFRPSGAASGQAAVVSVSEDSFTPARFSVLRTEGTFGQVSVGWYLARAGQGAEPIAQDVGPIEGQLLFQDGQDELTIELTVVQDTLPEPAEAFHVFLQASSLTGEAQVKGITMATLIIQDSDNVYGRVEFGPDFSHGIDITTDPRTLRLSITRDGGRLEDVMVNISLAYSDNGIEAMPENIFVELAVTATLGAGQDPVVVSVGLLSSAFLTIGGRFVASMDDVRLASDPEYGHFNSPTLGLRRRVEVDVSQAEANGESGFNNTASITVDEPQEGTLDIPLLIVREGMSGTAAIRWSVGGADPTDTAVNELDVAVMAGTINIDTAMKACSSLLVTSILLFLTSTPTHTFNVTIGEGGQVCGRRAQRCLTTSRCRARRCRCPPGARGDARLHCVQPKDHLCTVTNMFVIRGFGNSDDAVMSYPCVTRLTSFAAKVKGSRSLFCSFDILGVPITQRFENEILAVVIRFALHAGKTGDEPALLRVKVGMSKEGVLRYSKHNEDSTPRWTGWGHGSRSLYQGVHVDTAFDVINNFAIFSVPGCGTVVKLRPAPLLKAAGVKDQPPAITIQAPARAVWRGRLVVGSRRGLCGLPSNRRNRWLQKMTFLKVKVKRTAALFDTLLQGQGIAMMTRTYVICQLPPRTFQDCPARKRPQALQLCGCFLTLKKMSSCLLHSVFREDVRDYLYFFDHCLQFACFGREWSCHHVRRTLSDSAQCTYAPIDTLMDTANKTC